jgi:hypothetical protein
LTRAEASDATSYTPGQIVTFRRGSREQRLSRGRAYRVEATDAEAGTVSLATPPGKSVAWSPARWGGDQAEAFVEVEQELRTGDRIQFTRNNRPAGRLNGHTASVVEIDPQRGGSTMANAIRILGAVEVNQAQTAERVIEQPCLLRAA